MNFRQCKLQKDNRVLVSWIPDKFAKIGKLLRLKEDDGWKVIEVYDSMSEDRVKAYSRAYKVWASKIK